MRHRESHRTERIGWLRAAVLGANDGIVSTASLVIGVADIAILAPGLLSILPMSQPPSNLTMHRAPASVWDRQDYEHSRARSLGMLGFALIAAGTALVGIGYSAQLARLRCRAGSVLPTRSARRDEVNKAAEESFPASDPPAWTPGIPKPAHPEGAR